MEREKRLELRNKARNVRRKKQKKGIVGEKEIEWDGGREKNDLK